MTATDAPTVPVRILRAEPVPAFPFHVGQRVEVTTGGRRGEQGRVYAIYPRNDDIKVVTELDTLVLYHGPVKAVTE